jgi:arginine/ornithine N-succinyltransferase beta subunit
MIDRPAQYGMVRAMPVDAIAVEGRVGADMRTTGGGFVNLPPDKAKLAERLAAADAAFARDTDRFV